MPYTQIYNFQGVNTNTDARRIKPNKDNEGVAEATEIVNMDITREGALATSTGFEQVTSIAGVSRIEGLFPYEEGDLTSRYLVMAADDDLYYITPSNTTPQSIGDYGTAASTVGAVNYKGSSATRRLIFGSNDGTNTPYKWDGTTFANLGGSPPDGYIMAAFMGHLFVADGVTLYYNAIEDEDDWTGGAIGFNDLITGLTVEGKRLIVFTRTYNQGIIFEYDSSFNLTAPLKETYERRYGCLGFNTIVPVSSTAYYLSDRGVMVLGAEEGIDDQGLPRPMPRSKKIEPSLKFINKAQGERSTAEYIETEQQYWLAVPYGKENYPSLTFVYNENWDAWTTRQGFYPRDFALFRNSNYEQELYFADAYSNNLYKFNDSYSYDGSGYTRRWKSKIFTMGAAFTPKEFKRIDIAGAMDRGTEFDVTISVDGTKKKYRVDNNFIITNSYSEYLGDNWLGDAYLGGAEVEDSRFQRFYAPLDIPRELREGYELQITIENDGEEQPFKIDFLGIDYEMRDIRQVPRRKYINQEVT